MNLLTASRLKTARACARLDHYRYGLGYRPITADAESLALGSLVHKGLEFYWLAIGSDHAAEPLVAAIAAIRGENADAYAKARAEAMLVGYAEKWSADRATYEVLAVEAEFRAPLVNPETGAASKTFRLGGKQDVIVRERATGRTLIVEHKTSGEDVTPGSLYRRRLRMDGQVSVYFRGAVALGYDPAECLYDVLVKPRQRPYGVGAKRAAPESPTDFRTRLIEAIAAAPDAYYARFPVARDSAELAEADADAWAMAGELRDNARTNRHPRNVDACMRFGRCCEFIDVCDGSASLTDTARYERVENSHTELSKEEMPCQSLQRA